MGKYIVKLDDYYLEWSTSSDAPAMYGMSLEEFKEYYLEMYGAQGMIGLFGLSERLKRVEEKGHSCIGEFSIENNRAGPGESEISEEEIVKWYCELREDPRRR